ncbi:aldehyde dehydrogenase family protein [Paenibacillus sp. SEL3]
MNINPELAENTLFLERHESILKCLNYLIENRQEVMDILTQFSSYRAANAEIDSTILTLQGALQEVQTYQPSRQRSMAVFMPSNVILYSYALYLLIPSLYVENIDFRPSSHVNEYVNMLHEKLQAVHGLPIYIRKVSQKVFMENSVMPADIVVFTGSYTNAEKIKKQIRKDQLYIFYGQGLNPFIIGPDADLELAVTDVIRMRLFNSGQDCLGPDIILVHQDVSEHFKDLLIQQLDQLVFGANDDPNANYTPIFYKDTLYSVSEYFNTNDKFIIYGGGIDFRTKKMEPTVVYSELDQNLEIIEYFSPVFNVVSYQDDEQLIKRISSSYFSERAMGCSLYGSEHLTDVLQKKHTLTINQTLEDVDQGNKPFGGYGTMSNYIFYDFKLISKPILISEIVAEYLSEKRSLV